MKSFCFILIFATQISLAGVFTDAIQQNDFEKIKQLLEKGHKLEDNEEVVFDAVNLGSLEMLVFLLNNGATANAYTQDSTCSHVLAETSNIYQIVALLSHGASPADSYNREYSYAVSNNRWLHLVIYYYWDLIFERLPTPPNSIRELNEIISSLPLLAINSFVAFLNNNQCDLENLRATFPTKLGSFFNTLK